MTEAPPPAPQRGALAWIGANVVALSFLTSMLAGGITFFVQQSAALRTERIAKAKPLLDKQLELYFQTINIVSKLATTDADKYDPKDIAALDQLYWGQLTIVEGSDVNFAMGLERTTLRASTHGDTKCAAERQHIPAVLASCMRTSLEMNWGVTLSKSGIDNSTEPDFCTEKNLKRLAKACDGTSNEGKILEDHTTQ